jgi:hypothetical protein
VKYLAYDTKENVLYKDNGILMYPHGGMQSICDNRIKGTVNTPKVEIFKDTGFEVLDHLGRKRPKTLFHKDIVKYDKDYAIIERDEHNQSYFLRFVGDSSHKPSLYLTKDYEAIVCRIGHLYDPKVKSVVDGLMECGGGKI